MNANCQDRSWQKEFLEMKAHKSEVINYLLDCAMWCWDKWRHAYLHAEYEHIKENQKEMPQAIGDF